MVGSETSSCPSERFWKKGTDTSPLTSVPFFLVQVPFRNHAELVPSKRL